MFVPVCGFTFLLSPCLKRRCGGGFRHLLKTSLGQISAAWVILSRLIQLHITALEAIISQGNSVWDAWGTGHVCNEKQCFITSLMKRSTESTNPLFKSLVWRFYVTSEPHKRYKQIHGGVYRRWPHCASATLCHLLIHMQWFLCICIKLCGSSWQCYLEYWVNRV